MVEAGLLFFSQLPHEHDHKARSEGSHGSPAQPRCRTRRRLGSVDRHGDGLVGIVLWGKAGCQVVLVVGQGLVHGCVLMELVGALIARRDVLRQWLRELPREVVARGL